MAATRGSLIATMTRVEELIATLITTATAARLKLVAMELTEMFSDPEVGKFAAAWFAGRASGGEMRRRLKRDLSDLADYALKKMVDADDAGDEPLASARASVGTALGHLVAIVENGDRYGTRGGITNAMRFENRRDHLHRAFVALSRA